MTLCESDMPRPTGSIQQRRARQSPPQLQSVSPRSRISILKSGKQSISKPTGRPAGQLGRGQGAPRSPHWRPFRGCVVVAPLLFFPVSLIDRRVLILISSRNSRRLAPSYSIRRAHCQRLLTASDETMQRNYPPQQIANRRGPGNNTRTPSIAR